MRGSRFADSIAATAVGAGGKRGERALGNTPSADTPSADGEPGRHVERARSRRGYLALIAVYNGTLASAVAVAKRRGLVPERPGTEDLIIGVIATQRLARLVTKDRVTSAVRSPFTTYEGKGGPGEVEEAARGAGIRRAVGELLVCPFCVAQWIAGALCCGWLFAPRVTRLTAGLFAVVGGADFLQLLYKGMERRMIEESKE